MAENFGLMFVDLYDSRTPLCRVVQGVLEEPNG